MKIARFAPRGEARVGEFHWASEAMHRNEHQKRVVVGGLR